MPAGDPGLEQFKRAIVEFRNLHIIAGIKPLITMRQELLGDDGIQDRGGMDSAAANHFKELVGAADRMRRMVTHNPTSETLGDAIQKAIDPEGKLSSGMNPFAGDEVQNQSGGLIPLPFALDGSDPNIPLNSQLTQHGNNGMLLCGAIDKAVVGWTRLESRHKTRFITRFDSLRIYGYYQEIFTYIDAFAGDLNRVDIAQVLPTAEPLGPESSPNRLAESSGNP